MKTSTENSPTARVPWMAKYPPIRRVAVKPARIAIRMIGPKAELKRIAALLASR